jgi:hypothetical protein
MANNRMFLECQRCIADPADAYGEPHILLAKTFGGGYRDIWPEPDALEAFLDTHQVCSIENENVFRIVYESGEPNMDHKSATSVEDGKV